MPTNKTKPDSQIGNSNRNTPKDRPDPPLVITRCLNATLCLFVHYAIIRGFTGSHTLMVHPTTFLQAVGIHIILTLIATLRISGYALTGRMAMTKSITFLVFLFIILTPITTILDAFHAPYAIVTVIHCMLAFVTTPKPRDPPKKTIRQKNSVNWSEMIRNATSPSAQPA